MRFHQILVSAGSGDAVTSTALELRHLLRRMGESNIYSYHRDADMTGEVKSLDDFATRSDDDLGEDVLIFHASIGDPAVTRFLEQRPERLVVMYHNISPAEYFLPYAPNFARLLAAGRAELPSLAKRCELAIAVSDYNARELIDAGFTNVVVSPLIVDVTRLQHVEPTPSVRDHLASFEGAPVLLFVGQLLPHKRPDYLLAAYDVLVTHLIPDAHLIMVGTPRIESYTEALECYIRELNLNLAWITGPVSDEDLAAFYKGASLFVTASEHEGFCLPVLEAMSFGVPVVARGFAALPETVGDAGLVLDPSDGPLMMAEAMAALIDDADLCQQFTSRGQKRIEDFEADKARTDLLNHLLDLVSG